MRILITGGTGYLGYSLTKQILNTNPEARITIFDNLSRNNYSFFTHDRMSGVRVNFVKGELLDNYLIDKVLDGIEVVFHLAAKVSNPASDMDSHFYEQINHWGTSNLVDAIGKSNVRHVVYLSTTGVYGHTETPADEQTPPNPVSAYGISKLRGEEQIARLHQDIKSHIIRCGNVYGYNPCFRMDSVINKFMFDAHFNGRILINGDGEQIRSIIHIDKLVMGLGKLLDSDIPSGTYNIAEHHFTINEIAKYLSKLFPELEYLSINQHIKMKHIHVQTPCKILEYFTFPDISIMEELRAFRKSFAF